MKKLLMSLALLGTFAAMTAKGDGDSYMYWMVDEAEATTGPLLFTTAELYALDANGQRVSNDPLSVLAATSPSADGYYSTMRSSGIAVTEGWSFIVELYNGGQLVSQSSNPMAWAAVLSSDAIYSPLNPGGAGTAKFKSFNVPEPTSGLLMLFGLCGLALKRKRA